MRIWTLKKGMDGIYVVRDNVTAFQVEKLVSEVQAQYPKEISDADARFVKNSILLNTPIQTYEKDNNE